MNKLAVLILIATSAWAQLNPAEAVRKVVDIKHLSGERADRAVRLVRAYMHPVGNIDFEPSLKTAVLIGPEKVVAGAEALLAKFDAPGTVQPERQFQLRAYLVEASPVESGGAIPQEIAPAVDQMKKSFTHKAYRLVDTVLLQGKSGQPRGSSAKGTLPVATDRPRSEYEFSFAQANVQDDGKTVAIRELDFQLLVPGLNLNGQRAFHPSRIRTDVSIQEGQKLVIGKLGAEDSQNAIFLILTVDVQ